MKKAITAVFAVAVFLVVMAQPASAAPTWRLTTTWICDAGVSKAQFKLDNRPAVTDATVVVSNSPELVPEGFIVPAGVTSSTSVVNTPFTLYVGVSYPGDDRVYVLTQFANKKVCSAPTTTTTSTTVVPATTSTTTSTTVVPVTTTTTVPESTTTTSTTVIPTTSVPTTIAPEVPGSGLEAPQSVPVAQSTPVVVSEDTTPTTALAQTGLETDDYALIGAWLLLAGFLTISIKDFRRLVR